jgi:putative ATPase
LVLQTLTREDLIAIIRQAVTDDRGLASSNLTLSDESAGLIADLAGGDARSALNILEAASLMSAAPDRATILEASHKAAYHDRAGESHYNLISALHKSLRGSDADASLYWLARLIVGGEDPLYIVRRLVRFASEDIGLANSKALEQATAAYQAVQLLGLPECNVHLAQLVVYLAKCQKSNALYTAIQAATAAAQATSHLPVPLHLRNAPTSLMKDLGYGAGYQYSPDHNYQESQTYLPEELLGEKFIKTN